MKFAQLTIALGFLAAVDAKPGRSGRLGGCKKAVLAACPDCAPAGEEIKPDLDCLATCVPTSDVREACKDAFQALLDKIESGQACKDAIASACGTCDDGDEECRAARKECVKSDPEVALACPGKGRKGRDGGKRKGPKRSSECREAIESACGSCEEGDDTCRDARKQCIDSDPDVALACPERNRD